MRGQRGSRTFFLVFLVLTLWSLVLATALPAGAQPNVIPSPSPSPSPSEPPPPPPPPPPEPEPQRESFPPLPADSGSGRRIVYSQSEMRLWLVEGSGEVTGSWRVTGRKGKPKAGTYRVFSQSRYARIRNLRWEYMTRFARGRRLAMGFHSIPNNRRGRPIQSVESLGSPQYTSGGCVRMAYENSKRLYEWAPRGTVVVVTR